MSMHGHRVYNEMYTGDKWNDQEAWGKNDTINCIMIWPTTKMAFDKAGCQTGHPSTISLGNCSIKFQWSREGTKIATLLLLLVQTIMCGNEDTANQTKPWTFPINCRGVGSGMHERPCVVSWGIYV
ncbi:hypothetical protein Vafri_11161 [Volvox africanus]|nr:hypothetical protein Vafri_11161 [Volvox africanus]